MTYYILVHPDAVKDIMDWLANPTDHPDAWLVERVRVVTQGNCGWVTIGVNEDAFYQIIDNFDHYIIYSQHEV